MGDLHREGKPRLGEPAEQAQIEGACMIFDGVSAESLADLGTTRRVGIAELFVAMMTRETKLTASI